MAYFPFCLESWILPHERCNRQRSGKHHTTSPSQLDFLPPPGLHPRAESSRQVRFRCTRAFCALGKLFSLPPSCKAMGDMCSWLLLLVNYLREVEPLYPHLVVLLLGAGAVSALLASLPLRPPAQLLTWSGCSNDLLSKLMQYVIGTNKLLLMFRVERLVPAEKDQGSLRIGNWSWKKM